MNKWFFKTDCALCIFSFSKKPIHWQYLLLVYSIDKIYYPLIMGATKEFSEGHNLPCRVYQLFGGLYFHLSQSWVDKYNTWSN